MLGAASVPDLPPCTLETRALGRSRERQDRGQWIRLSCDLVRGLRLCAWGVGTPPIRVVTLEMERRAWILGAPDSEI